MGTPRREFLFVDDLADACLFLIQRYRDERPINVGCGEDLTIASRLRSARPVSPQRRAGRSRELCPLSDACLGCPVLNRLAAVPPGLPSRSS